MPSLSSIEAYLKSSGLYLLLVVFSSSVFLMHYLVSGQAVYGDGIGYYAHLRSWVIDGDWDYTNEYKHNYSQVNNNSVKPTSSDDVQIVATLPDGRAENHYSPGVAILLLPYFFLAHVLSIVVAMFNTPVSLHGYSDVYQIITGLGAVIYVVAGLWLLEQVLCRYSKDGLMSRIAVISIFFATQLLYYGAYDVINSHFASFFLVSLFLYLGYKRKISDKKIFLLGIIGGLLTVNRLQDGILAFLWFLLECKNNFKSDKLIIYIRTSLIYLSGYLMALLPLLYHWSLTFDGVFKHTYIRNLERDVNVYSIDFLGSLFHPNTGLFSVSPLLLLVLIFWISKATNKTSRLYLLTLSFFIAQVLIITVQGGWYAAAYGGRMYISSLPFFAVALVDLLTYLKQTRRSLLYIVPIIFIILNCITASLFVLANK